jgi:prepilin-type N-terminal cleavage/methylation domain-containing protein
MNSSPMTATIQQSRKSGFTLVELLVVGAIVAVLAASVAFVFGALRSKANQAVSAANLRQLVAANLSYAADHQTYCPTDLDGRNLVRWHGGRSSVSAPFDPTEGLLAEYLGETCSVGFCPELKRLLNAEAFNEEGAGGYGYNDTYIGSNPFVQPIPGKPNPPNRPAFIGNPARTLMFATVALAVDGGLQDYASAAPPYEVDANGRVRGRPLQPSIHFRFGGRALVGWCDGTVTAEPPSDYGTVNFYGGENRKARIGYVGKLENNGVWNPRN